MDATVASERNNMFFFLYAAGLSTCKQCFLGIEE